MNFDLAEIKRRLLSLEQNRGASLRFGTVTEVSEANGTARVQLIDGENMVSHPLRILQDRTKKDQKQCFPDIGESVACLFSGQGFEEGVILGATYNKKSPSPNKAKGIDYIQYQDGTELSYDREKHEFTGKIKGKVHIEATEDVFIKSDKKVSINAPEIALSAKSTVSITAPQIALNGMLTHSGYTGGATTGTLNGTYKVNGDILVDSISSKNHTHGGVDTGNGSTDKPK